MKEQDFGKLVATDEFHERFGRPVILQFQPDQFHVVESPEQLRNWESLLQKRVGLPARLSEALASRLGDNGGTCCESGDTNDCDVD